MADYTSTVELILNGLDKLKQAEDRIKRLDGKNVNIKFDVDSSSIKKVQDSLKQVFNGGGSGSGSGGTTTGNNMAKGVRDYFTEYNKAIKEGFKATEQALSAGEKTHLRSELERISAEYFKEADKIRESAKKNLGDKYKDFESASKKAMIAAKAESDKRQEVIVAKQVQQHYDNMDRAERIAAERSAKEQAKIAQQRQQEIEKAFNDAGNAQIRAAKESQNRVNSYLSAARSMGNSSQAKELLKSAKEEAKNIDNILQDKYVSIPVKDAIKNMRDANNRDNAVKDSIQQQKDEYKAYLQSQKDDAKEIKEFEKEYRAIAENALKNQMMYRNAARGYIGESNGARAHFNIKADGYDDTINGFLNDKDVSQEERNAFQQKVDFANETAQTRDTIKEDGIVYKYASNQASLYTKELNGLYASYTRLTKQAIKANLGSKEQGFLYDQAKAIREEYNALRAEVEPTLSVGQMAQLDYMEQKSDLSLREAATTQQASIDAAITNLKYKNILDSQKRINSLELERSKISEKETDLYGKYTTAIENAKLNQEGMIANYGTMSADQQAQIENLKQEGIYRKENYDILHQVGELDKQINSDSFEARLNANSKMKGIYKDEISAVRDLYANAQNETDMRYASKREQALFAQAAASNNTGLSFIDKFKNGLSSFTTMLVGPMALFRYGVTAAKAVMSNVTQMDSAMTELYKVTDNSQHEYDKFREATKKTSDEIGATQVSLVQSTATFARLGYNLSDSAELGKNAALFSNVGDEGMTSTEAAEDMVAIMKGFNIQAEDSIHIVDALNQVGKLVA